MFVSVYVKSKTPPPDEDANVFAVQPYRISGKAARV